MSSAPLKPIEWWPFGLSKDPAPGSYDDVIPKMCRSTFLPMVRSLGYTHRVFRDDIGIDVYQLARGVIPADKIAQRRGPRYPDRGASAGLRALRAAWVPLAWRVRMWCRDCFAVDPQGCFDGDYHVLEQEFESQAAAEAWALDYRSDGPPWNAEAFSCR